MMIFKIISPFILLALRILSILIFLATLLAAFGGKMNPTYFTFPALFCLAFPYFAILTILITVFWIFKRKIILSAMGVGTIILCLTPLSVAFPLSASKKAVEGSQTFKILSWNVLHTRDIRKPEYEGNRAIEFMIDSEADIIGLAEMKNFDEELTGVPEDLKEELFKTYPYRAGLNTTDIKVLSKYPVERMDFSHPNDYEQYRFDFFRITFPENRILIVGMVHLFSYSLTNEERKVVTEIKSVEMAKTSLNEFKGPIRSKLSQAFPRRAENASYLRSVIDDISPEIPLIVCGDFNDVPVSWTYNLVRGDDMRDAYAETNFGPAITYNLHAFYFHIDQMLYRGPIEALNLKVEKINSSDHYPLLGEFSFLN